MDNIEVVTKTYTQISLPRSSAKILLSALVYATDNMPSDLWLKKEADELKKIIDSIRRKQQE